MSVFVKIHFKGILRVRDQVGITGADSKSGVCFYV